MVTEERIAELREAVAACGCRPTSHCDAWSCFTITMPLDEIERLKNVGKGVTSDGQEEG